MQAKQVTLVAALLCALPLLAVAEDPNVAPAAKATVKIEHQEKGTVTGVIVKKEGAIIMVKSEAGGMVLWPYWRGGMPKDGGGFDKEMVKQLEGFQVGDKVTIAWTLQEHHRIDTIERAS